MLYPDFGTQIIVIIIFKKLIFFHIITVKISHIFISNYLNNLFYFNSKF